MKSLGGHRGRLPLLLVVVLALQAAASRVALASGPIVEPTYPPTATLTPVPPTATPSPTATIIPSPTYLTATPRVTDTPTPSPIPTQFFWGAAEATAVVSKVNPPTPIRLSPLARSLVSPTPDLAGSVYAGGAWIPPAQENAERSRLTQVEAARLATAITPTPPPLAHAPNTATPTDGPSFLSTIPSRMKLTGPVDPNAATPTASDARAGLPPPPPIRYAGVPSQSREAGWINGSTLWLAVPHRSQFDGTGYAATNCGPASLGMILEAYGLTGYPTDAIRGEVNRLEGDSNPDDGTSLYAIASVAQRAGLYPMGLSKRWTLDEVRQNLKEGRPIITLTRYADLPGNGGPDPGTNHYIVLSGLSGDQFIYNDPAYAQGAGRGLIIPAETLARAWADSDVPGQGVAFALDSSGAGLMSPLALRPGQGDDEADGSGEDADPTVTQAAIDEGRSSRWSVAIRTLTSAQRANRDTSLMTMESLDRALASGPSARPPQPIGQAGDFPWAVLAVVT